jgi:hypothetical protein
MMYRWAFGDKNGWQTAARADNLVVSSLWKFWSKSVWGGALQVKAEEC